MATEFNLPGSSFEEVQKILKGYSSSPDQTSLDSLAKLVGLHRTIISRNNKFLTDIGLISGGIKKGATELGRRLGRALDHRQIADAQSYWREAVQTNEKVSGLVTTVRIKGGMSEKDFSGHVLYVSGQKNTSGNKTGARCVVDVLLAANLLEEANGKLIVTAAPVMDAKADIGAEAANSGNVAQTPSSSNAAPQDAPVVSLPMSPGSLSPVPQIAINIQLHLPETENAEVYEKLFRALREQLLSPKA